MGIYEKLGVPTLINATGTVTRLGGSLMAPGVIEAMREASLHFVDMNVFHREAGRHIAKLLGGEDCCVTCGAAAGIAISAAACMTRGDAARKLQLPDTAGMKREVIMLKAHRILYDQALRLSGAKVVEVGVTSSALPAQVEAAINEQTAMFFYVAEAEPMRGSIPLPELIPILKKHAVPVLVDAAAEIPPRGNFTKYLQMGADLAVFSGGKELRGPQSSGLILGRKDLIEACSENCCPQYGIGRAMKIDKETVAGIVRAVELYLEQDEETLYRRWTAISHQIAAAIQERDTAAVHLGYPQEPGVQPVSILRVYLRPRRVAAAKAQEALMQGNPQIYTDIKGGELVINPQCLRDEDVQTLINGLTAVL